MYRPTHSPSASPSPSPSPEPEIEKWYENEFVKGILRKLIIVSWFTSHLVLFIIGVIAAVEIDKWFIGVPVMLICWIIMGTSIWIMVDYFEENY